MKNISRTIILSLLALCGHFTILFGQTLENNTQNLAVISSAPVSYRVNVSGSTLHGYYKKDYKLTIYGDSTAIGYRADCDKDDDWSHAKVRGTTQSSNSFETTYGCVFNPHKLYGTVLPGNAKGQYHYDNLKKLGVGIGDLTMTYKLNSNNKVIDSVVGVVFDRGPHNQPGESSVAVCNKFKPLLDNNQFIYIVFPNTAKHIKKVIGTKADNKTLKRNPENADIDKAYLLMLAEESASLRKQRKENLLKELSQIPVKSNFDNATAEEKAAGKLKPKNNDRNLNE
ncbi:hypothetical protein [Flavobacterium cerinum]|uniref:SH3 domain-containing protein n=1 Tax=Flavobacterium cerinum TaxID=2502784 RepID=A0ABY5IPZ9_9FLAO|nr:hypothetical protein [Flavobacterium cerinum]UUC44911.1 hypothetical protein NOX80_14925 [Flavobacterium cerinum]